MGWIPDNILEALGSSHSLGIFFRLDIDPPLRLWMGINDVPSKIESIDEDEAVYLGAGRLLNVPALEILINGVADRVEFQLSGIDPTAMAEIEGEDLDVRGKEVNVGITTLDEHYQPMSGIIPLWSGRASFVSERSSPVSGTASPSVSLALSVGSGSTTRERVSASLWSAPQQRALFPTDAFCDGTARLARGVQPTWPRF